MSNDDLAPVVPDGKDPRLIRRAFERLNARVTRLRSLFTGENLYTLLVEDVDIDAPSSIYTLNHDNLAGYVADEHVAHSSVSVSAGNGLTGGGTIASTRTLSLDIDGLTADATPDRAADYVATHDDDGGTNKKVLLSNLWTALSSVISVIAGTGLSGGGTLAASRTLNLDVNGLTEETSIDDTDFIPLYDTTATAHRKAKPSNVWAAGYTQQTNVSDATTSHAITDPADTPADADALRDDLVANTIPDIESALDDLGTKINAILTRLETLGLFAS